MKAKLVGLAAMVTSVAALLAGCSDTAMEVPPPPDLGECHGDFCAKITEGPKCKADLTTATIKVTFSVKNQTDPKKPWKYEWIVRLQDGNVPIWDNYEVSGEKSHTPPAVAVKTGTIATITARFSGREDFVFTVNADELCGVAGPKIPTT